MARLDDLVAITFDFGNTLVPVRAPNLAAVVDTTAAWAVERWSGVDVAGFRAIWREERERQFLEDLPRMHEADLDRRAIRVVARLRGQPPPPVGEAWDDGLAATFSEAGEIRELLRVYADAFIAGVPAPAEVGGILARLALRWRLGVVSNWPLGVIVERYLEAAGWRACFDAVVVSQTVGWIKPDRRIFEAAAARLGIARPASVLHVGDDLGADVAGARAVGWRTAWLRSRPLDSPLPTAEAAADVRPDLTLDRLEELPELLGA